MRRWSFIVLCLLLVVAPISIPEVQAWAWLNYAQISRLHGVDQIGAYEKALALAPKSTYIRLATGDALIRTDDLEGAATVFLPLIGQHLDALTTPNVLAVLATTGHEAEALQIFQTSSQALVMHDEIAAHLLLEAQQEHGDLSTTAMEYLFAQLFGLDRSNEAFHSLITRIAAPDFWSSDFGKRLTHALTLRSALHSSLPSVSRDDSLELSDRAAILLNVDPESVSVDENLIANGDFEAGFTECTFLPTETCHFPGWSSSMMSTGNPWNLAAFIVGPDQTDVYRGLWSLRIDGLYIEHRPDREPARAGYVYSPVTIADDSPYLISFAYRTKDVNDSAASIWLSSDPRVLFNNDYFLPPTNNRWKYVTIITWNRTSSNATIQPILRSFSEGSVWFDAFSIRHLNVSQSLAPREPLVMIADVLPFGGTADVFAP